MTVGRSPRIAFLDRDHVLRLGEVALSGLTPETQLWCARLLAPEPFDAAALSEMGRGLRAQDGVTILTAGQAAADADILIFRRGRIDRTLMESHPSLKLIQRLGARSADIDLEAAATLGIYVCCIPRPTLHITAEHAILLMLALGKKLLEADASIREARFAPTDVHGIGTVTGNWTNIQGVTGLYGRTLGLVGLGEVGSLVAGLARAFGMRVLYCGRRRYPADEERVLGVEFMPFGALLSEADVISLHATDTPENVGLMDRDAFGRMRPNALFVNTSRGRLVDEDALFESLRDKHIAGAGLDVHAIEPRPAHDRFYALDNVILTPHMAAGSRLALLDEIAALFDNARAVLAGGPPVHGRIA